MINSVPSVICIMIYILFVNFDRLIKTALRVCLSFTGYPFSNAFINIYKYFSLKLSAHDLRPRSYAFFQRIRFVSQSNNIRAFPPSPPKKNDHCAWSRFFARGGRFVHRLEDTILSYDNRNRRNSFPNIARIHDFRLIQVHIDTFYASFASFAKIYCSYHFFFRNSL